MDSDVVLAIALWLVCGFLSGCCLVPVCFHGFYRSCLVPGWFLSFLTGSWIGAVVWVVRWHFERCTQVCTGELDPRLNPSDSSSIITTLLLQRIFWFAVSISQCFSSPVR